MVSTRFCLKMKSTTIYIAHLIIRLSVNTEHAKNLIKQYYLYDMFEYCFFLFDSIKNVK